VGHWSDRTLHRLGRRRPWLFASALLLPLGFVALWVPPTGLGAVALALWFGVWVFFLHTALTVFEIPHRALGAELSPQAHDRTRVFAASTFVTHIGGVAAIACVALLERADDPRSAALPIAIGVGLATAALIALGAWRTPEPPEHRGRGGATLRSAFRDIGKEPFARAVLGARLVQQIGLASTLGLLPFVSDYLVGTPGWTAYYLASAVTGLLLAIPLWVVAIAPAREGRLLAALGVRQPGAVCRVLHVRRGGWAADCRGGDPVPGDGGGALDAWAAWEEKDRAGPCRGSARLGVSSTDVEGSIERRIGTRQAGKRVRQPRRGLRSACARLACFPIEGRLTPPGPTSAKKPS
jgi:hypothetical protein